MILNFSITSTWKP